MAITEISGTEQPKTILDKIRELVLEMQRSGQSEAAAIGDLMEDIIDQMEMERASHEEIKEHLIGVANEFWQRAQSLVEELQQLEEEGDDGEGHSDG